MAASAATNPAPTLPAGKMRAIVYRGATDASKVTIGTFNEPKMKDDEVLIQVKAFGLNFADIMARNGTYQDAPRTANCFSSVANFS